MKNIEKNFPTGENKSQTEIQKEQAVIKPEEESDFDNGEKAEEFNEKEETRKKEEEITLARDELEKVYRAGEGDQGGESENIEQGRAPQETIEFRFNQSRESRLAEYVTGLRPDDPKMTERLISDHNIVRSKYGLPEITQRFDAPPGEYENFLRDLAKQNKVEIRDKSTCGKFFEESDLSAAYLNRERVIGINMERESPESYQVELAELEHEMIHSMQHDKSPRMPIEGAEYEAYIAVVDTEHFKKNPEITGSLFNDCVKHSVDQWYSITNKERRRQNMPELKQQWDDPEYFLKNVDKTDQKEIEKYKQQNEPVGKPGEQKAMEQARNEVETAFSQGDNPIEKAEGAVEEAGGAVKEVGGVAESGPPIPSV